MENTVPFRIELDNFMVTEWSVEDWGDPNFENLQNFLDRYGWGIRVSEARIINQHTGETIAEVYTRVA